MALLQCPMHEFEGNIRPVPGQRVVAFSSNQAVPIQKIKPISVTSPKVRLRLQDAMNNANKSRFSQVKANLDYRKENAYTPPKAVSSYVDERGRAIGDKNKQTTIDKIINPFKESYEEPMAVPRCNGSQALENYRRSQVGVMGIGGPKPNCGADPDLVCARCPSTDGLRNREFGQRGTGITRSIQHLADFREPCPGPKVRYGEAMSNYENSVNSKIFAPPQRSFTQSSDTEVPHFKNKIAQAGYERNQGGEFHKAFTGEPIKIDTPAPRVRLGGEKNYAKEGEGIKDVLISTSKGGNRSYSAPTPASHTRPEAVKYAELNKGTLTRLQFDPKSIPVESQPQPRVRPEAQNNAERSKGMATKNLFQKYGHLPADSKPPPRVTRSSMNIYKMSQGSNAKNAIVPPRMKHSRKRWVSRSHSAHH